jgi:hypothetical protein
VLDVRAGRVEVRVAGHDVAGLDDLAEEQALGGASLVRRDHVREAEQALDRLLEAHPAPRARVGLVSVEEARPLVRAHRGHAAVGQEIDRDEIGGHAEQVPARGGERPLALLAGGEGDRLDDLDPVRLDARAH